MALYLNLYLDHMFCYDPILVLQPQLLFLMKFLLIHGTIKHLITIKCNTQIWRERIILKLCCKRCLIWILN